MKTYCFILIACLFPYSSFATVSPITGTTNLCLGSTSPLTNTTPGGAWSSSNTSIATIGSSTGIVTGLSVGSATITYSVGLDFVTASILILPLPTFCGCNNVGVGDTTTLYVGGVYISSGNPGVATVNSSTGKLTGIAVGTAAIWLVLPTTGCASTTNVSVTSTPLIHSISGISTICNGSSTVLSDSTIGGSWSSSNSSIATISSSGLVTGISANQVIVTYSISGGAATCTEPFYVYPLPDPISGPATMCLGDTITLHSNAPDPFWDVVVAPVGGLFTSSDTAIANIVSATYLDGNIRGIASGTATITYTDVNGLHCYVTSTVTVNSSPVVATIVVDTTICVGAATSLTDTTVGGLWNSDDTSIVAVGSSGTAFGVSAGTATIMYSLSNGCGTSVVTKNVTVNPLPEVHSIAGSSTVCAGSSIVLSDATPGGEWMNNNTIIAAIGSLTGIVNAHTEGVDTIRYSVTNTCGTVTTFTVVTINPIPGNISGGLFVCPGSTTTLTDAVADGTWSSSNSAIATIDIGWGIVTGISSGTTSVTYELSTGCLTNATITVNDCSLNVNQVAASSDVGSRVFPNPTTSKFIIESDISSIGSGVVVYNVVGEKVYESTINSDELEIDISPQPSGIYLIHIVSPATGKTVNRKILKE